MGFRGAVRKRDEILEDKDRLYGGVLKVVGFGRKLKAAWCDTTLSWNKRSFYFLDVWNLRRECVIVGDRYYDYPCRCCGMPVKYSRDCLSFLFCRLIGSI